MHSLRNGAAKRATSYTVQIYTQKKLRAEIGDTIEIDNISLKKPKDNEFL